jgi:hypothetical protein
LESRLTWKEHIAKKIKQIDLKVKDLYWIIGHKSIMSLESKVLLYKTIIKLIWTYGIELWGCASKSNITIMQAKSVQNAEDDDECTMVCHQPDPARGLKYSLHHRNHPGEK